ncbi:hypothetical protein M514_07665 [Trichuris suis]|uniref:Uncharacterized protein n=1 Tax=Trichuris suis TaxID=68888 RepID=A0A085M2K6_9BILA|nr:hypothetical protein M513_07665 [Trichuris suis]KFD60269.1 hypothetical protein M514_07665 [Trichuris suis]
MHVSKLQARDTEYTTIGRRQLAAAIWPSPSHRRCNYPPGQLVCRQLVSAKSSPVQLSAETIGLQTIGRRDSSAPRIFRDQLAAAGSVLLYSPS